MVKWGLESRCYHWAIRPTCLCRHCWSGCDQNADMKSRLANEIDRRWAMLTAPLGSNFYPNRYIVDKWHQQPLYQKYMGESRYQNTDSSGYKPKLKSA